MTLKLTLNFIELKIIVVKNNKKSILIVILLAGLSLAILANNTITAQASTDDTTFKLMTYNIEATGEDPNWKDVVKE